MYDISGFADYLNNSPENKLVPWSKRGLVPNAPKEAIKAYEEYKKSEREKELGDE